MHHIIPSFHLFSDLSQSVMMFFIHCLMLSSLEHGDTGWTSAKAHSYVGRVHHPDLCSCTQAIPGAEGSCSYLAVGGEDPIPRGQGGGQEVRSVKNQSLQAYSACLLPYQTQLQITNLKVKLLRISGW